MTEPRLVETRRVTEERETEGAMLGKTYEGQACAIAGALDVVGERWTLVIVRDCFFGVRRFDDFANHLDVPRAVLSNRLKSLVAGGVVCKVKDATRPGRWEYKLTRAGQELWRVIWSLVAWGSVHARQGTRQWTHAACGTVLDASGGCARCAVTPWAGDVVVSPRPGARYPRTDAVTQALRA